MRSATVAMRQWSTSSCAAEQPDDGLGVPGVDRQAASVRAPHGMSRPMSNTGTECVSAPTEMKSAPVSAYARDRLERDAARHLDLGGALEQRAPLRAPARASCCRAARRRRRRRALRRPGRACRTRPRSMRPGQRARARSTAFATPSAARWLSLISTASDSESRWLKPPPARTAARCDRAQAGQGLAGVEDARPGRARATHVPARQRRDAASSGTGS